MRAKHPDIAERWYAEHGHAKGWKQYMKRRVLPKAKAALRRKKADEEMPRITYAQLVDEAVAAMNEGDYQMSVELFKAAEAIRVADTDDDGSSPDDGDTTACTACTACGNPMRGKLVYTCNGCGANKSASTCSACFGKTATRCTACGGMFGAGRKASTRGDMEKDAALLHTIPAFLAGTAAVGLLGGAGAGAGVSIIDNMRVEKHLEQLGIPKEFKSQVVSRWTGGINMAKVEELRRKGLIPPGPMGVGQPGGPQMAYRGGPGMPPGQPMNQMMNASPGPMAGPQQGMPPATAKAHRVRTILAQVGLDVGQPDIGPEDSTYRPDPTDLIGMLQHHLNKNYGHRRPGGEEEPTDPALRAILDKIRTKLGLDARRDESGEWNVRKPDTGMAEFDPQMLGLASVAYPTAAQVRQAGVLTTKQRKEAPSVFNPGKKIEPANGRATDEKHFPIPDIAHARNALSRVEQYDKVPSWFKGSLEELKASVKAKVYKKFPELKKRKAKREASAPFDSAPAQGAVRTAGAGDGKSTCKVCGRRSNDLGEHGACNQCLNNRCWTCGKSVAPGGTCHGHKYDLGGKRWNEGKKGWESGGREASVRTAQEDDDPERQDYDRKYHKGGKIYPCPTCKKPNRITAGGRRAHHQCDECADRDEGLGGYSFISTTPETVRTAQDGGDQFSDGTYVMQVFHDGGWLDYSTIWSEQEMRSAKGKCNMEPARFRVRDTRTGDVVCGQADAEQGPKMPENEQDEANISRKTQMLVHLGLTPENAARRALEDWQNNTLDPHPWLDG